MTGPAGRTRVTVILTTYNHERFIQEALDSVLQQQTDFPFDVVIIEDCSTDRTREIVRGYHQEHPDVVHLILPETNQCSNANFVRAIGQTSSQYFATLDGDDYWTTPHKLQKQVDYLDLHPECSICYHNVRLEWDDGSQAPRLRYPPDQPETAGLGSLIDACIIQSCATMIRRRAIDGFPPWYVDDPSADWTLLLLAALHGNAGYVNEVMGVYRQHAGGYWSSLGATEQHRRIQQQYDAMMRLLPAEHHARIETARALHAREAVRQQAIDNALAP